MRGEQQTAYFLVDGKEADVRLFHGKEEHQRAAPMADAGRAATAMHEGTADRRRGHEHHVTVAEQTEHLGLPVHSSVPTLPPNGAQTGEPAITHCEPGGLL